MSTRLRFVLRDSDLLARQGGDEFIVLIADIADDPRAAAEAVAGKLLDVLREPFVVAGAELRVGASIGISIFPDDAADTETLLRHADTAMYRAKAAGGGQLAFHRASGEIQSRRLSLATQLRRAITRSELELHYQPIWQLDAPRSDRRRRGAAALAPPRPRAAGPGGVHRDGRAERRRRRGDRLDPR